jgi:hypothetical protein
MHRAIKVLFLLMMVSTFLFPLCSYAKTGKKLVTINGEEYTDEEFKNWWTHWNDKNNLKFPDSPDDFIAFKLMTQQGIAMGFDTQPNYLHKLDVFLQVRAMMALKYEEVDSKIKVTDDDLRKYFDDNYSTIWDMQILSFDSEEKAQKAYEVMLPLQGQVSGQLVFSDMIGGTPEEKPLTYDEAKACVADFYKNKKDDWLPIVRSLQPGEVSKPFLFEVNKYILIRLVKTFSAEEGVFEEKRPKMTEFLVKEKRNRLTMNLIEGLKKKYNVKVDQDLLDSIKLDIDYPQEFLDRVVVSMNGYEATVKVIIYNANKERKIRKDISDQMLKDMIVNSIISQSLINKESLARGYEKRPPLLATYEFYKQNRLRAEVEASLNEAIAVTDLEIQAYYDSHRADFTVPEKVTFSLLTGDEDVLNKVWLGALSGGDFTELSQRYSLESKILSQEVVSLSPILVKELNKLDRGGVSSTFAFEGKYGLIKLFDRLPGQVSSLEQVKPQVIDRLKKEKFEASKIEYLNKLKSRSKIIINEGVWNDLAREFGNGK